MAKIRIHELAKKLGIPKAQLLAQLTDAGVAVDGRRRRGDARVGGARSAEGGTAETLTAATVPAAAHRPRPETVTMRSHM